MGGPMTRREAGMMKMEASTNGKWVGPSQSMSGLSPKSPDYDEYYDNDGADQLDRRYLLMSLSLCCCVGYLY